MKICWDMLEGVWLTQNGNFRKGTTTYIESVCIECWEPFLAIKSKPNNVFCSGKCSNKGNNNPFFGKKHTEDSIDKMSKSQIGKVASDITRKKLSRLFSGSGNPNYKGGIKINKLPLFDTYAKQISYVEEVRSVYINSLKILEVRCAYCGRWFVPKIYAVKSRIKALLRDPKAVGNETSENWFCCAKNRKLKIEFIRAEFKKEGYELLTTVYKNNRQKLKYICPMGHKHSVTWKSWNSKNKQRSPFCNNKNNRVSKWEKEVKRFLIESNIDHVPNNRTQLINPETGCQLELDIWIPDKMKAVECNGLYWHSEVDRKKCDRIKKQLCKNQGIDLLVITDKEWNDDVEKYKRKLISFVSTKADLKKEIKNEQ